MRAVFLGSGAFAIPSFNAVLSAGHEILAAVTQPDRRKGRGRTLTPPALKPVAERHGIAVLQPAHVRTEAAQQELRALAPDVQIVVAYGQILPPAVIGIAPYGTLNVHGSLLPHYRGAAPIQWAIASGETRTGVTTMMIDEGLDTGPILLQRSLAIDPEETAGDLEPRLAALGAELLVETLAGLASGDLEAFPQIDAHASLAPLLRKSDALIDWTRPAEVTAARIRGFNPWPGTYTSFRGKTLRVLRARPWPARAGAPGEVLACDAGGIIVACGATSALRLIEVQPESRRAMAAAEFARGVRLTPGDVYG